MAITFVGIGTVSPVTSGNMTPVMPAGLAVGDIVLCVLGQHDNVVATMPTGWTSIAALNNTTALRSDVFWRRVMSTAESSTSITVTRAAGDAGIAHMAAYRGVVTSGSPTDAVVTQANASSTTITVPTATPLGTDRMCVFIGAIPDDGANTPFDGTDPVPTEEFDELTALGLDVSINLCDGIRTAATATGARTCTNVRTAVNNGTTILLKPAIAGTLIVLDDFDRADAGTLGSNWTDQLAGWSINTNRASAVLGNTVYTGAAWTGGADQYAEATIAVLPGASAATGPTVRSATGADTCYSAQIDGTNVYLLKHVAGAVTTLGTVAGGVVNDVVRCEAQGTTIRSLLNGVLKTSVTDSAIASGGPGLFMTDVGDSALFDMFAAGVFPLAIALDQEGFRWRNDDGSETTATWKAAQDTNVTAVADQIARLRMIVNAAGDNPSKQFKLQYRKVGDVSWRDIDKTG